MQADSGTGSSADTTTTTAPADLASTGETGGSAETGSTTSTAETGSTSGAAGSTSSSSEGDESDGEWGTCSQYCYDELCTRESEECSSLTSPSGECVYVACGRTIPCPIGEYCDVSLHRCHRLDGECSSDADCPNFGGSLAVECDAGEGLCTVTTAESSALSDNELELVIEITEPDEFELVTSVDELEFRWTSEQSTGVHFVYVFDGRPDSVDEAPNYAIWGAAVTAGAQSVSWEQGSAIEDGEWSGGPGIAPEGEALYAIVIGYDKGKPVSTSLLRSFFVGSGGWPEPGDSCSSAAIEIPGDCYNPTGAFGCIHGTCRIMCASNLDCYLQGMICGFPDSQTGLRYCV